jgi:hypothetical protein
MATSKNATSAMILERIDNLANIAEIFLVGWRGGDEGQ